MSRRPFLAPEFLQISSMDCGVASVACLLAGYGVRLSYERLRARCRTSVDGTSIDTLEDLCNELGVDVCQHIVPVDCIPDVMEGRYPLIAVVGRGLLRHFVTVWRRIGDYLQVMDPAGGRQWVHVDAFKRQLYQHHLYLPKEEWAEWMEANSLREVLERRARRLLSPARADQWIADAFGAMDPDSIATGDASLRMVAAAGRRVPAWNDELFERAVAAGSRARDSVPATMWAINTFGTRVVTKGALLLAPMRAGETAAASPPEVENRQSCLSENDDERDDGQTGLSVLHSLPRVFAAALVLGVVALALASALEIVVYRAALDAPRLLTTFENRAAASLGIAALMLTLLLLEGATTFGAARLGRSLELRLRMITAWSLPRVDDEFVRSRPTSDLANRAHNLVSGRQLPSTALTAVRAIGDLVVTLIAIAWLGRQYVLPVVLGGALLALSLYIARSRLRELDTRNQIHASRLLTLFLDALRGLRPIRLHGYQDAFRDEQRRELKHWRTTGDAQVRMRAALEAVNGTLGIAMLAAVFLLFSFTHDNAAVFVLLAFWAFRVPGIIRSLVEFAQSYPLQRIALTRLLEVTRYVPAPAASPSSDDSVITPEAGVSVAMDGVSVVANGTRILEDVTLHVPAGQSVAIVGASGSGKSTLVSLLLGFHRPAGGSLLVDSEPLTDEASRRLRAVTSWVDPSVQLWNDSVRSNVEWASRGFERRPFLETVDATDLLSLLNTLDRGLDTDVGPEGRLISGGEGQRIRLARAHLRARTRLVILDEAFRGLDRPTRTRLMRGIRLAWPNATVFYVSHDISHALEFERVLVIDGGKIVEDACPSDLRRRNSRFRHLLDAEQHALDELWGADAWRRIHVGHGSVSVEG